MDEPGGIVPRLFTIKEKIGDFSGEFEMSLHCIAQLSHELLQPQDLDNPWSWKKLIGAMVSTHSRVGPGSCSIFRIKTDAIALTARVARLVGPKAPT